MIPITILQASPYQLTYGTNIKVYVIAFDSVGSGPASAIAGSAVSATVPDAPVSLTRNNALTSTSQISLTWSNGAFNGGSEVIDY